MLFDTTTEPEKDGAEKNKKKCFRCGSPATRTMVVGESSLYDPVPVYTYVCDGAPYCPFRTSSSEMKCTKVPLR